MNTRSAEAALRVDSREELVFLLGQACEIEHGLMCEYLYAQFSLKRSVKEGLTPDQLYRVQAWESALISVIKKEMLHLALGTNILTALGAAPHFERPNFPILSRWYPQGVKIALVPFGEEALRHFIFLERPEGMDLDDAASFPAARHARPLTVDDSPLVAVPQEWHTVGHLYRGIEEGLAHLCEFYGEDAVFIGPTRAQAVTDIFEWPELIAVSDLASARQAIRVIVEEGEGARGDWIKSHFGTFVGILEDLLAVQASDPNFNPARPVEPNFVRLPPDVGSGRLIDEPLTARVADAGPTFDIVRPASFVLPHREAAWKIIKERLDVLTRAARELAREDGLDVVDGLADRLSEMAQDVGLRLSARDVDHEE